MGCSSIDIFTCSSSKISDDSTSSRRSRLTSQITWLDFVLSLCSTCSTKISVLLLYRRILTPSWRTGWNVAAWAAIGVTTAYFVAGILAFCLICDPLWAYWMAYDPEWDVAWHCADGQWLNYFIGIVSVLSDLYAIALPLVIIGQTELHIPWKQKWTTYFFFCLGIRYVDLTSYRVALT